VTTDRKQTLAVCCFASIAVLLIGIRFYGIDTRSLHSDEGVQWYFYLDKIVRGEPLLYRPEFHGLAVFYISALPMFLLGDSLVGIRFMTVVVSCLALLSWWFFASRLGVRGLLIALLFAAISPSLVYYSSYVSQHAYLVLFLFTGLLLVWKFSETERFLFLYLLAPVVALLVTSHALGLFYLGLTVALGLVAWFSGLLRPAADRLASTKFGFHAVGFIALVTVCTIAVASSFFTSTENLQLWLGQLGYQSGKAFNTGHNKEMLYYLRTFAPLEMFAFIGTVLSPFLVRKTLFNLFVMLVTFSSILMLSFLPYKVPWLFILALTQMYFLSGLALEALLIRLDAERDAAWLVYAALLLLFVHLAYTSFQLNIVRPLAYQADNPLSYVGPVADAQRIYDDLDDYLAVHEARRILVILNTHWPLPYYLQGETVHYLPETDGNADLQPYLQDFDVFIVHNDMVGETTWLKDLGDKYEMRENHFVRVLVKP
jgi:uncharacterized protein (TIGR03663 family)